MLCDTKNKKKIVESRKGSRRRRSKVYRFVLKYLKKVYYKNLKPCTCRRIRNILLCSLIFVDISYHCPTSIVEFVFTMFQFPDYGLTTGTLIRLSEFNEITGRL